VLQYRAELDAAVTFTAGGRLQAQAFRLDVPHPDVTHADLAGLLVSAHGLHDVERVEIGAVRIFAEPRVATVARQAARTRFVELSQADTALLAADPPLERLAELPALVVRGVPGDLESLVVAGHAVLLQTGGSSLPGDGARWLVEHGAALVGTDSGAADPILLGAGIPVVEHLIGLAELPPAGFRFTAVPPRAAGLDRAPVRAYATVPFHEPHDHGRSAGWLPTTDRR